MTYAEMDLFRQSLATRGGETGRLIAERNWSASPLGPIETWPQALRAALGLILPSPVPMVLLWGDDGIRLYNDAYSVFGGGRHPALLGSKVREGWPEVADFNQNVLTVGLLGRTLVCRDQELTLFRHGKPEQVFMNLDNSPVLGEDGRPAGVLSVVVETTDRVHSERQQSFLVMLGDALSDLSDPVAATSAAAGLLGRHLDVGRAGYGDIDRAGQVVTVARDWSEGGMISLAGEARILDAFGPAVITELRAGRTLVVEDCRSDPRTADPRFLATWDSIGTRALVVAPLLSAGCLVALLYVHSDTPRHWTGAEISLVEDVGARTWATVQRVRAESILRENEERLRLAAQAAQIGTWDHDLASGKGHWDDAALRIAGLPPDLSSYDGSSWTRIVHPEDRDHVSAAFQASLEPGGPAYEVEFRCSTQSEDGGPRWLTSLGTVFRDPATGLPVRAIGIMRDATNRRRDQERLAESESQLRLGLAAGGMVAWTYDLLNGEIHRSENAEEIFGPGTTPTSFIERMPADDVATDQARLAAAIAGEVDRYESEFRYRHPDGRHLWLSNHGHVVRNRDGKPLRLHGVCIDITARKVTELALQQSEEQFKNLADRVPNFVWFAAPSGELRYLNQRWYEYTGQTPDQALPDGWATTLHADDAAVTAARWSAALHSPVFPLLPQ